LSLRDVSVSFTRVSVATMNITFTPELNNKPDKNGLHTVLLRITKNRKHQRTSLNFAVKPEEWNITIRRVSPKRKGYKDLNRLIEEAILQAKAVSKESEAEPAEIKRKMQTGSKNGTFYDYAESYLKNFQNSGTLRGKEAVISKLRAYKAYLNFDDITKAFVLGYIKHLKEVLKNNDNTIQKNISTLKTIYMDAIDEEFYKSAMPNPFKKLALKTSPSYRERLTFEDIERIEALQLVENSVHYHARNIFLLQYYSFGCRISDMLTMKWENVKGEHIIYETHKNHKLLKPLVTSKSEKILELYRQKGKRPVDYIFPFLKNHIWTDHREFRKEIEAKTALINKSLRAIAEKLELKKHIHTHVSRHSFAENSRIKTDGDIFNISKSLGHSRIATTEGYLSEGNTDETDKLARLVYA